MKKHICTLISALLVFGSSLAQNPIQYYLDSLNTSRPLNESVWGACAIRVDGTKIAGLHEYNKVLTASNMKLITTGVAIKALGADYQYVTKLGYSGTISNGTLRGDIYIIGSGDPTTCSPDSIATPKEQLFQSWLELIKKAGIRKIKGHIIGDPHCFEGQSDHGSWCLGDIGTYYGTGATGLNFYKNVKEYKATAGASLGAPVIIEDGYPNTPWIRFSNIAVTAKPGTGDELYLYNSDFAAAAEMRGEFGIDHQPKTLDCSNKFAAYTCAYEFYQFLEHNNIKVKKGAADVNRAGFIRPNLETMIAEEKAINVSSLTILGETKSPSLKRIAYITNHISDNFYAETLLRTVGKEMMGDATYYSSHVAERRIFRELGIDDSYGVTLSDGSGLARSNYVSPDFMCRFLTAMYQDNCFPDYVYTLGQPGTNPSYRNRVHQATPQQKQRVFMKSGSMGGVLCYSGYIMPEDGNRNNTIIFSIMTNNCTATVSKVFTFIDGFIYRLLLLK